jgi:hypothetical protein
MPDWVYEVMEASLAAMATTSLLEALLLAALGTLVWPIVVLIHETGHALAAFALGRRVSELTVGDDEPVLTVRVGGFRLRLGALTGEGEPAGFVVHEAGERPRDTLVIALAGPIASLAGAAVTAAATVWAWPELWLSVLFGLATFGGIIGFVGALQVSGDRPENWSDGVWVRAAWRAMRRPD